MSYYDTPESQYYVMPPAGTPGWQFAPVPGWGINPLRAGPARVGVGCLPCAAALGAEGDKYIETTWGHCALAGAAGMVVGAILGFSAARRRR